MRVGCSLGNTKALLAASKKVANERGLSPVVHIVPLNMEYWQVCLCRLAPVTLSRCQACTRCCWGASDRLIRTG